jgi:hypothetical protein
MGVAAGVLVVAAMFAWAPPAGAVTIGSNLKPAPDGGFGYSCGITDDPCTVMQLTLPGDPYAQKSPFDGAIRKWRFRKGSGGSGEIYDVRLWVVQRDGPGLWGFVRHSQFQTIGSDPGIYRFGAHLQVHKGDRIAMELPAGDISDISTSHQDATEAAWFPAPGLGDSLMPDSKASGFEKDWNATIRRP